MKLNLMTKTLFGIGAILVLIGILLYSGIIYRIVYGRSVPPIADHFACSDYCPGDASKYTIKVYSGVTDAKECLLLGGRPLTYYGWGVFSVCKKLF